jgi:hypothetical protein
MADDLVSGIPLDDRHVQPVRRDAHHLRQEAPDLRIDLVRLDGGKRRHAARLAGGRKGERRRPVRVQDRHS